MKLEIKIQYERHYQTLQTDPEISDAVREIRRPDRGRQMTNTPLGKRKQEKPMISGIDHAEREIILGLKSVGVDIGADWGHEFDLNENP